MFLQEELRRYSRQLLVDEIGLEGQRRLKGGKVLVIGAGGLGCPVLQCLVVAGVGEVGIVDDDVVDVSNLHRQMLYSHADVGRSKALVAAEKLRFLNPFAVVRAYPERLTADIVDGLFAGYDVVVDGSDNFATRYLVNDGCVRSGKPLVFGSVLRFEGQVSVFNYQGGPTYRCLFPEAGEAPNCSDIGVMGVVPGIVGSFMANEVMKLVGGFGVPLSGKLLLMDVLNNGLHLLDVQRVAELAGEVVADRASAGLVRDVQEMGMVAFQAQLRETPDAFYLVDVREPYEWEEHIDGGINIPLSELPERWRELPVDRSVVFCCAGGVRSRVAAHWMREWGFSGTALALVV